MIIITSVHQLFLQDLLEDILKKTLRKCRTMAAFSIINGLVFLAEGILHVLNLRKDK